MHSSTTRITSDQVLVMTNILAFGIGFFEFSNNSLILLTNFFAGRDHAKYGMNYLFQSQYPLVMVHFYCTHKLLWTVALIITYNTSYVP
jgi:hypothetical protein